MKILAIACEQDAGAAVNIDGKVTVACNEERFNREKLYIGFPEKSILACCKIANLEPNDFDCIAVSTLNHVSYIGFTRPIFHQKIGEELSKIKLIRCALRSKNFIALMNKILNIIQFGYRRSLAKKLRELGFNQKIYFIDHHTCHAFSTYCTSAWKDCLVITLDGAGDGYCSKVFVSENNKLKEVHSVPFYGSPGYYYAYARKICGFKRGREGKLTGLSAFGNPEVTKNIFANRIEYNSKEMVFINKGYYLNSELEYLKLILNGAKKEDIAAGIQTYLEEMVTSYILDLIKKFNNNKPTKLALAGGVFANVKLNQKISELKNVDEVYVHPHMGDGGLAVGASFALLVKKGVPVKPYELENAYLGPEYSKDDILRALKSSGVDYSTSENPAKTMAKAIYEGRVVAYYSGKMEYGPRALGHRSIFVSAKDPSINQSLNERLQRSEFMPFAPIILKEKENDYFLDTKSKQKCTRFMTVTSGVTEKAKRDIPAAIHIDGTARFQTITKEQNPVVYEMLKTHEELTGIPIVINTSFNMHEEPIVESPEDAIKCFQQGHLDMLVLENYILERKETYHQISPPKKIKVLMVNHEFPPIGGGGGTTTRFLAKELTKLGVDVSILTAKPQEEDYIEHAEGFDLYYIGPTKTNIETSHIPEMTRFIIDSFLNAKRIIKSVEPDLVHSFFSIPAGCFGLYSKKIFNIPYITSALGADVPEFNIGDWRLNVYHSVTHDLTKSIWKNSSYLIANSPSLKNLCNKFLNEIKVEIITNGVDLEVFYPNTNKRISKNNEVQILFISRLSPQKGVETLIKSCGTLKKKGISNFKLTIVGDGPLKEKMFSLINEYQIPANVNFLGWKKLEELPDIYRSSDIFILPSVMEGMSSVVLQAMACGLPVIGSKVQGFSEVLEDNINGYNLEPTDYKGFADALEKLIHSPELREKMSKESIKKANKFSWESVAKKYLEFYEKVVYGKKEQLDKILNKSKSKPPMNLLTHQL